MEDAIVTLARKLGEHSVDAYWDENDGHDGSDLGKAETIAWIDDAWRIHWLELVDAGATDADLPRCKDAYVEGFTGKVHVN